MAEPVMLVRDCVALLELDRERQMAQLAVLKNRVRVGQRRVGIVDFFRLPPAVLPPVKPEPKWVWKIWVVAQDTTYWGGEPKWVEMGGSVPKSVACDWLASLPGSVLFPNYPPLSTNPQFVKVYVVQKALNNSSIVGTWAGYLPQVLAQMGCP